MIRCAVLEDVVYPAVGRHRQFNYILLARWPEIVPSPPNNKNKRKKVKMDRLNKLSSHRQCDIRSHIDSHMAVDNGDGDGNDCCLSTNLRQLHLNDDDNRKDLKREITNGHRRIWITNDSTECEQFQLFCGHLPFEVNEMEIFNLFEPFENLQEVLLMTNPSSGQSRGFAFVTFTSAESSASALAALNEFEIRDGIRLKLNTYTPNKCLYIGNIPKSKDSVELKSKFVEYFDRIVDVITYRSLECPAQKNRGFCFIQFESHDAARIAKSKITRKALSIWGTPIFVDWADALDVPDESIMSEVRVLYVRNLTAAVTEEQIRDIFGQFGAVERVKKMKDFAFVHFEQRSDALEAMKTLQNTAIDGETIEVKLSRPPADKRRKEEMLRAREMRMLQLHRRQQTRSGTITKHAQTAY